MQIPVDQHIDLFENLKILTKSPINVVCQKMKKEYTHEFQGTNDEKIKFVKKISTIMPLIYQPILVDNPGNHKDSG